MIETMNRLNRLICVAVLVPLCITGSLGCTFHPSLNVTSGISSGKKFVVSVTDCCTLCSEQSTCVAATYANFYCSFFTSVTHTESANGVAFVLAATAAPTPIPTAEPPLPPPSAYSLLTTSMYSGSCAMTSTFMTETVALALLRCQDTPEGTGSSLSTKAAGGLWLHSFPLRSCQGTAQSTWFPHNCTFDESDEVYRMGRAISYSNTTGGYQIMYSICEALCEEDCNAIWTATSGMCNQGSAGSSSSSGGSSSDSSLAEKIDKVAAAGSWMAVYEDEWALVFQYKTVDCSGPSSALAYPCGACYSNDLAIPRKVSCTPQNLRR